MRLCNRDARHELVGAPRQRDSRLRSPSGRCVQGSRDFLFLWVLCKCLWVAPVLPSRIVVSVAVCRSLVGSISLHCLFIVLCLNTCPFVCSFLLSLHGCWKYVLSVCEINVLVQLFPLRFVSFPFIDSPSYIT